MQLTTTYFKYWLCRIAATVTVSLVLQGTIPALEVSTTRKVDLEGQSNFRDIGGYKTGDGKSIKRGLVFRSGDLNKLTDADLQTLKRLRLKTVVNFLTDEEISSRGPDRLPHGVHEISRPIESDDGMVRAVLEARKTADFSRLSPDLNPQFHRMLVNEAKSQYAALFRDVINSEAPLVFHCSHGVHRTGTATAILLWSIGVPWDTVREDYLLSNRYRHQEVQRRLDQLRQIAADNQGIDKEQVDMTNIRAFYILDGSYIDATRQQILQDYQSVDGYLSKGLGLSDDDVRALRERLLE